MTNGLANLRVTFAAALVLLLFRSTALAHDPFTSWANARIKNDHIEVEATLSRSSALLLLPNGEKLPSPTPENFPSLAPALKAAGNTLFEVTGAGVPLAPRSVDVKLTDDDMGMTDVLFRIIYPAPAAGPVRFTAVYLEKMVDDHVGTLVVTDHSGKDLGWEPLSLQTIFLEVPLPPGPAATNPNAPAQPPAPIRPATPSFKIFFRLGIEHIVKGFDHLLFLAGLLVACRRFRTMAIIITCFTVAHSITLALAALDIASIPPRIVEPLIAVSIVYVGIENLLRRGEEPRGRWALTFLFGLIHGFGFASVLRQIGLGKNGSSILSPLFSFNLGVELGQIAIAALFLPVLFYLRRQPSFVRYGLPVASALITLAGIYWLVQRTLLS